MSGRRWTDDETDRLRALVAEGLSTREVAAALDRTEEAVSKRASKLRLRFSAAHVADRKRAAMIEKWQNPEYRAMVAERVSAAWTEERRAALGERCSRLRMWETGHAAMATGTEARERQRRAASLMMKERHRQAMAWCPPEYRDDYHALRRVKRYPAAEARAMINAQIERDAKVFADTGRHPQMERMAGAKEKMA